MPLHDVVTRHGADAFLSPPQARRVATGADAALPLLGIIFLPCAMIMDMLTWTRGPATGPATDHPAARSARKSLRACGYPAPRGCPDERPGNEPEEVKRD